MLPLSVKGQASSDLLKEYLFPIQYGADVAQNDVIGLRIYKNLDNQDPLTWYLNNVNNPKDSLPEIKADGYVAVLDDRTVYIQAANLTNLAATPTFYTNIYVLAYNQNAAPETISIFNQMLANIEFNKNIMDLYCLKTQSEVVKEKLRRDTIRKADLYKLKIIFSHPASLNLQSGTYVPNMSISTWPSWQATLGKQLGTALPVDPLNIMADKLIPCGKNEECETGQCSGGYCSACKLGWDPRTCWNERTLNYQAVDGFVYKYKNGVLTIRYEYPQIIFPDTNTNTGTCFLGCEKNGAYYVQGSCLNANQYCNAGVWTPNECGDNIVRCNEVCDCDKNDLTNCNCKITCANGQCTGCLSCKDHYHAVGSLCEADTQPVTPLTQTLSTSEETRWTGSGWSEPYATACKTNAVLDNVGVCHCKSNYHESAAECIVDTRLFTCIPKPAVGALWNTVGSYEQGWDGEKWVPADSATEYSETPSDRACHFKAADNFHWDSANSIIVPNNFTYNCLSKPDNSVWNSVDSVTQTWNAALNTWVPGDHVWTAGEMPSDYNETAVTDACHFKCADNFHWENGACVSNTGTACAKDAAVTAINIWQNSAYVCTAQTCVANATLDAGNCVCNSNYNWNGSACCMPNCAATGHNCGDDGCGGSCGSCTFPNICSAGSCCPTVANIQVCADNAHTTYFNGTYVSSASDWSSIQAFSVNIIPGKNVIAIKAVDWGTLYGFSATLNRGNCSSMTTDDTSNWKCINYEVSGWTDINFDDSSWPAAVWGNPGTAGPRAGNALTYNQIWAQGAGEYATVYCRYSFTAD